MDLIDNKRLATENRPIWSECHSGDALVVRHCSNKLLLAVIDGTGHGEVAHQVSNRLATYLNNMPLMEPTRILEELHEYIKPSIGASVGVALINTEQVTMEFAGVGNISAYVLSQNDVSFVSNDGVIGGQYRRCTSHKTTLKAGDLIVIHSDGIQSRFYTQYQQGQKQQSAGVFLTYIFKYFAKEHDDASCIVYRF